jgi:hypothetical protein
LYPSNDKRTVHIPLQQKEPLLHGDPHSERRHLEVSERLWDLERSFAEDPRCVRSVVLELEAFQRSFKFEVRLDFIRQS